MAAQGGGDHLHEARTDIEARVIEIVASALSVDATIVKRHSSLTDDLGAESIDFLDLVFRLESAFGIKIPEQDLWRGSIDQAVIDDPEALARAVESLKERMPEFRWDKLPAQLTRQDLARLITVGTVVDYLETRV